MKLVKGLDGKYIGEVELKGIDGLYENPEEIHDKVDEQIPGADTWSEGTGIEPYYRLYNQSNNIAVDIEYTIEDADGYYVTSAICGMKDEEGYFPTLEEAEAERDRLNAKDKEEGGTGEFWVVIDEEGHEIQIRNEAERI